MTTQQTQQTTPGTCCDPKDIAKLACESKRIERQAEVTQEIKAKLDGYRTSFENALAEYTAAWKMAEADRAAAEKTLEGLRNELRCRLDEKTQDCLSTVWGAVKDDLDNCVSGTEGCRVGPCDPNASVPEGTTQGEIAGRIQDLREQVAEHAAYFEKLLTEITELPGRAAKAKEDVTKLDTDSHAPAATPPEGPTDPRMDPVGLNARALVAAWHLAHVRKGFDSVEDFYDCLCRALTAVMQTWKVIVFLEGEKAYRACIQGADTGTCATLLADPVGAVLDRFAKDCTAKSPTTP